MQHRIRVAVLISSGDRLLLVKHVHARTGFTWWVPPGGGLEGRESIFDCARREVAEETNLEAELERVVYIRQFLHEEYDTHHLELYMLGRSRSETVQVGDSSLDLYDHDITDVQFLTRDEMADKIVFPSILHDEFWDDLKSGFPETRYLGVDDG